MYRSIRYILAVVSVMVLTTPVAAAPPVPQLGTPVVVESGDVTPFYTGYGGVFGVPSSNPDYEQTVVVEGGDVTPFYTGCGGVFGVPSSNPDYEQTVVEMVNATRAEYALPPLKRAATLNDAARYHATDMALDNYFSHESQDRVGGALQVVCSFSQRVLTYYNYTSWNTLSENIAAGYSTPASVMAAWMASDGHRANILRAASCEIGVGYYEGGGAYGRYWVQNFGCRNDFYPIVINRESAATDDYRVNLYIYGSGTWSEMRLRNNSDAWDAWRPFQSQLIWALPQAGGAHTVWVELRNGSQTTISSDNIYSTWSPPPVTLNVAPTAVTFVYDAVTGSLTPPTRVVNLTNSTTPALIDWSLATEGNWFAVTPADGTTPGSFTIAPTTFMTQSSATYIGAVTATAPPGTVNAVQRIPVTLDVQVPALGGLPDAITFTYSIPSEQLLPSAWTLTPRNVGSDHTLQWSVTGDAPWMQIVPQTGTTPQSFSVTPVNFSKSGTFLYTGMLTVTVDDPTGVAGSPHQVRVALKVVDEEFSHIYLPLVNRNF